MGLTILNAQSHAPFSLSGLGGFTRPSNLHLDILTGRDEEIRPEDILVGALLLFLLLPSLFFPFARLVLPDDKAEGELYDYRNEV